MTRRRGHPLRSRRAFTLIELIATMVVLSIISAFASSILINSADGYFDASTTGQLHHELSVAMDRVVRELRRIDRDDAAAGIAPNIDSVTADSIDWRDKDDDLYTLSLSGSTLSLSVDGGVAHPLLDDVGAFSIQTYDDDNAALGASLSGVSCDPIRRIELSITLTRNGVSETLDARIFLRSTMSGL